MLATSPRPARTSPRVAPISATACSPTRRTSRHTCSAWDSTTTSRSLDLVVFLHGRPAATAGLLLLRSVAGLQRMQRRVGSRCRRWLVTLQHQPQDAVVELVVH